MLNKSILNAAGLRKVAGRDVANPATPASPAAIDLWRQLRACWKRLRQWGRRAPRRLRLCDSLPLGERRFVAVVEFESSRFLLGGTTSSLVLLARLGCGPEQGDEGNKQNDKEKEKSVQDKPDPRNVDEMAAPARPASGISARFES